MEDCLDWSLSRVLPALQQRIMEGSTYHGIPTLKCPLDFWVYQEILWQNRPEFIIEIGNFRGGSALALAHACDAIGLGQIIGVDINHDAVHEEVRRHPRITLLTGDACQLFADVANLVAGSQSVMVIEDSAHTFENTLKVLETYSPLVGEGQYFIVEDSICHHGLDIGPNPGPYEAIESFVSSNKSFIVDRSREAYSITWNPKGYLLKVST